MDNEQNQEQQRSSVDRVNDLINKSKSTYKNAKRAKRGLQAGRVAAQVGRQAAIAAGQAATSTAGAWGPVAAIIIVLIVIIILFSVIIAVILGEPTNAVTPPDCVADLGGTCYASTLGCPSDSDQDQSGARCLALSNHDTTQKTCCIKKKTCAELSGTCESGPTTCADPKTVPYTTATCTDDPLKPLCCAPLTPDCAQYVSDPVTGLKNIFNIVPSGGSGSEYSTLFRIFCDAGKSSGYTAALKSGGNTLRVALNSPRNSCSAYTPRGQDIIYLGPWTCGVGYSGLAHWILHESGHVIGYRSRAGQAYPYSQLVGQDDACYSSAGFMISYSYPASSGVCSNGQSPSGESFAESISNYITYKTARSSNPGCAVAINDFPTRCYDTYLWFKSSVFSGYNY